MAKKSDKKRKKPAAPQAAPDKYKRFAPKPAAPEKNRKPLLIAIAAAAAVCVAVAALFLTGVFGGSGGSESIDGYWTSDDGFSINVEGDTLTDSGGNRYRLEFSGDTFTMYVSDDAEEGAGEYFMEFAYALEGDTLTFYNASDAGREYPEMVFVRSEAPADSGNETPSSSDGSPDESSRDEPDDAVPDFEKLGIADDLMRLGVTYPYTTKDYNSEEDALVKGTLKVADYTRGPLTDNAKKFAEENGVDLTGYESCVVTVDVYFECMTPSVCYLTADYYNAKLCEDNFETIGVSEEGTQYARSRIIYNGREVPVYMLGDMGYYKDDYVYSTSDVWEIIVPEGYDGVCVGYYNEALVDRIPDGVSKAYSYDYYQKGEMLYFRCV